MNFLFVKKMHIGRKEEIGGINEQLSINDIEYFKMKIITDSNTHHFRKSIITKGGWNLKWDIYNAKLDTLLKKFDTVNGFIDKICSKTEESESLLTEFDINRIEISILYEKYIYPKFNIIYNINNLGYEIHKNNLHVIKYLKLKFIIPGEITLFISQYRFTLSIKTNIEKYFGLIFAFVKNYTYYDKSMDLRKLFMYRRYRYAFNIIYNLDFEVIRKFLYDFKNLNDNLNIKYVRMRMVKQFNI